MGLTRAESTHCNSITLPYPCVAFCMGNIIAGRLSRMQ